MNNDASANLLNVIKKLEGFDTTVEEHQAALIRNKAVIEVLLPFVSALGQQTQSMAVQIATLKIAILSNLNKEKLRKIVDHIDKDDIANNEFFAAYEKFLTSLAKLK